MCVVYACGEHRYPQSQEHRIPSKLELQAAVNHPTEYWSHTQQCLTREPSPRPQECMVDCVWKELGDSRGDDALTAGDSRLWGPLGPSSTLGKL